MHTNNRIIIAGMGVKSVIGEDLMAFSRVLYQTTQQILEATFVSTESDVIQVALEALEDAGVHSDTELTIWMCGQLPTLNLQMHLANSGFAVRSIKSSPTLPAGLEQAVTSFFPGQSSIGLVISEDDMGIGALVLARKNDVISGDAYGIIEGLVHSDRHHTETICQDALSQAGIDPGEIGYFETVTPDLNDWVLDAYRDAGYDLTCAWGSLAGNFLVSQREENTLNTSICSLIRTLYALFRRTLPAFTSWKLSGEPRKWHHTPFYTIQQARPWFVEPGKLKRYASWLRVGPIDVTYIVLSEPRIERNLLPVKSLLGDKTIWLLPVTGQNQKHLQQNLKQLKDRFDNVESIQAIYNDQITQYVEQQQTPYALAVVGRDKDEVMREIALAIKGVDKAFANGKPYRTPRGSVFNPDPLRDGDVAFVYPGAFNSYVGFGRELLQHFPFLHERLSDLISNVGRSLAERRLYPRSLEPLTVAEKEAWAKRLTRNPIAMIESGTTFAIAYSMIMREVFQVQPRSAMGYSLGEISMLWSAGVWNTGDAGSDAWHASPLFKTRLFGPKQAVREAWDIQPEDDTFWSTYLLKAPEDEVIALVAQEPRVYLTIVNLPGEVVIAGDGEGCQRIIHSLGCHAIKTPFDSVIHNEVVRSEYDTFVELYTHPVTHKSDVVFYSAAEYAPLELNADSLAHAIADMTCKPVHLPRLVKTVYDGGARIFIELGPQATCTRWINRILHDEPHVAVAINRTGLGDFHGIISVLAQLITNRIQVNLLPLLPESQQDPARTVVLQHDVLPEPELSHLNLKVNQPQFPQIPAEEKFETAFENTNTGTFQPSVFNNVFHRFVLPQQQLMAQNHLAFLQTRHNALQEVGSLIEMQMTVAERMLSNQGNGKSHVTEKSRLSEPTLLHSIPAMNQEHVKENSLFTKYHLDEFASGNVENCFGSNYAIYRGRRLPRIPNSDLLLMSRIIDIQGTLGVFDNEPYLVSEYDVPDNAWFYKDLPGATMPPYAVLMEIALQPCGFLSAYLGSTLSTTHLDYYFRNLDGHGQFLCDYPVRGKTIINTVKLVSSISLRGIIMQRYEFALQCEGIEVYKGGATFGYFTSDALSDQVGLDKGKTVLPYYAKNQQLMRELPVPPKDQLHGLDKCTFNPDGGLYGKGYIYGEVAVDPDAWFFKCHFYQDPVMPGSLGVELMYQALGISMRSQLVSEFSSGYAGKELRLSYNAKHEVTWMYRGQVKPRNQRIAIEVHIKERNQDAGGITSIAEGSLWVDGLRIYSVSDIHLWLDF